MEFSEFLNQLWENKPGDVVLMVVGFFLFVLLVVDASKHNGRHPED